VTGRVSPALLPWLPVRRHAVSNLVILIPPFAGSGADLADGRFNAGRLDHRGSAAIPEKATVRQELAVAKKGSPRN
jgi:hypothetical protein